MKQYLNVPYKQAAGHDLCADFFIPETVKTPPVILWIHGGGWKDLNRNWCLVKPQIENGYAVCSVDYRYSDEAIFPAQMLDLKDALLFVKENGARYGYDASNIILSGDSAGGHLATLLGVSAGNTDWEKPGFDYSVQAVVDFCGPCSLGGLSDGAPHHSSVLDQLLGTNGDLKAILGRGAQASPTTYINGSEPPFLILHGSEDSTVDPSQSRILRNALEAVGVPVHMYYVPGGEHGLSGALVDQMVCEFLNYYIKKQKTVITPQLTPDCDRTVPVKKQSDEH